MANTAILSKETELTEVFITSEELLEHWQGHRRLTRRVIEAFPEDKLFTFSIGGVRPFLVVAMEFVKMAGPIARRVATGKRTSPDGSPSPHPKSALFAFLG